jgi:hypothetical protein
MTVAAMALLAQQATAATISTSVIVPVTDGSGFTVIPVSGLSQFDPANGTLTGVSFSLDISSYDLTLSLGGWEDPQTGAAFESANMSAQISISAAMPNGGGLIFSSTSFSGEIYNEFDSVNIPGTSGGPVSEEAMERLTSDTEYNLLPDFLGTGEVSILGLGIFTFGHPEVVTLDDGTFAYGDPQIDAFNVGPSTLTIDYTYTPTVVPAPAAVWLLGSGLLGLAGFRRARQPAPQA